MRYVRYEVGFVGPKYGWILEDKVGELQGTPFGEYRRMEADLPIERVRLLPPVLPGKIIGIHQNFPGSVTDAAPEFPKIPRLYLKPPSSIIGSGQKIVLPVQSRQVVHEVHLGVVIGRTGRWITPEDAIDYIFGFTIATEFSARDLELEDNHSDRARAFDTFLSIGPWVETDLDVTDLLMTCRVKDELRQMASTREMIFTVPQLVAFISSIMTLDPGDLILAGTPVGSDALVPGDIVQSSIEGIGDLVNPVWLECLE
ncbi:MAG TPA: fumarylacetoacetate hydrolase family protein [Anaerolineaceae bacterium]|nr:fumarylacetoacetate hydrolase family protein [Anaerolineaceae bacterium]